MQKLFSYTCAAILLTISTVHANSRVDSIGVENLNGKKVVLHKIDPSETYYALGRKYNVAPKDIISFNNNKTLVPGIIIKVPTQLPFTATTIANTPINTPNAGSKTHTVKAKDNLSQIATTYGTTVALLKEANNLTNNNLSIGQKLIIPGTTTTNSNPTTVPTVTTSQSTQNSNLTEQYIEYVVKPREFLNKIAEDHNTTVDAIKKANNLTSNNLSIGQTLKIPLAAGQTAAAPASTPVVANNTAYTPPAQNQSSSNANNSANTHTVIAGETIFSIAQRYSLTAYQLREANSLTDNTIQVGQKLKVPGSTMQASQMSVPEAARTNNITFPDTVETITDPTLRRAPTVYGLNQVEEKGTAVWIDDPDLDSTKMLVLHRTLPVGSVIMVKNPMVNISTFAKVVGKFTENETTKDVIIVVTKAVADKLGVLDKRFFCNLTYAVQENDK